MIGPSLIERFDSFEASNLLSRKTYVPKLPRVRHGSLSGFSPAISDEPGSRVAVPFWFPKLAPAAASQRRRIGSAAST